MQYVDDDCSVPVRTWRDAGGQYPLRDTVRAMSPRRSLFPGFDDLADQRRRVVAELARERQRLGLSQTEVAARMHTSQSAVARLEAGNEDLRLSTLQRYAAAVGHDLQVQLSRRGDRDGS
jgi:ribosome-binding protein aMBF1 (putative translation factor)